MYCKKCGKAIPDDSKYCPFCGANLFDIPPIEPIKFDETKNHIDQHRLFGAKVETKNNNVISPTNSNNKPLIIVTKIALAFCIVAMVISLITIILASIFGSDSKANSFKIAWYTIVGLIFLISGGLNFSIIFIKRHYAGLNINKLKSIDTGFRIVYLIEILAAAIFLFICVNAFIKNPTTSGQETLYFVGPMMASVLTLIFSGSVIGFDASILSINRISKILSR